MSITADAPWTFIKLRRSGMFIRRIIATFWVGGPIFDLRICFELRISNFDLPLTPASPFSE